MARRSVLVELLLDGPTAPGTEQGWRRSVENALGPCAIGSITLGDALETNGVTEHAPSDVQISDDDAPSFDAVMRTARRWYYSAVRSLADEAITVAKGADPGDHRRYAMSNWLDETLDGHQLVIINAQAEMTIAASDNSDTIDEAEAAELTIGQRAYYAIRADVWQLLDARTDEWESNEESDETEDGEFTVADLEMGATLATGQCCDLKVDTGQMRVWLCRVEGGVTTERLRGGRWEITDGSCSNR
jgi:hypothetical protein